MDAWIGVDLDGTLAHYDTWRGAEHIGEPIVPMVDRVKKWLEQGKAVRIFTARIWPIGIRRSGLTEFEYEQRLAEANRAHAVICDWSKLHFGVALPITCAKDYGMVELWDDRAVQVEANTGNPVGYSTRGL